MNCLLVLAALLWVAVCSCNSTCCEKLSVVRLVCAGGSTKLRHVLKVIVLTWGLASVGNILNTILKHRKVLAAITILLLIRVQLLIRALHHHLTSVWKCSSTTCWSNWLCLIWVHISHWTIIYLMMTWIKIQRWVLMFLIRII